MTSPIVVNIPTGETENSFVYRFEHLNNKNNVCKQIPQNFGYKPWALIQLCKGFRVGYRGGLYSKWIKKSVSKRATAVLLEIRF